MSIRKSDDELKQLAIDYVEGKIYTSIGIQNPMDLRLVFMPLTFMNQEQLAVMDDVGMLFEYLTEAAPGSINGKPIFMSCSMLTKEDTERFADFVNRYLDFRKSF
jgi:hypothetical protein